MNAKKHTADVFLLPMVDDFSYPVTSILPESKWQNTVECIKIIITNGIDSNDKKRGTETLEKNYRQKNSTGVHMHLIVLGIKCRWK